MGIWIRMLFKLLLGMLLLLFFSCRTREFASDGYFTGDVDKYFNEKEGVNIWVYRAFQPRETGQSGLRTTSYYPLDTRMMKMVGLGKNGDKVMFSVVPENRPKYNMVVVKHRKRPFKVEGFEEKFYEKAPYYIKDFSNEDMFIKHVYIPYGNKESISMLFYALKIEDNNKDKALDRFNYLAGINAKELKEEVQYKSTWQIFDCEENQRMDWTIQPNLELMKARKKVYLKIFDIYGPNKTISYFKLIKKGEEGEIKLKLCPNDYVMEYYDEEDRLLERKEFRVGRQ